MTATESLRLPIDAASRDRGAGASTTVALTYLFERTTGDDPFDRDLTHGPWSSSTCTRQRRADAPPHVRRAGTAALRSVRVGQRRGRRRRTRRLTGSPATAARLSSTPPAAPRGARVARLSRVRRRPANGLDRRLRPVASRLAGAAARTHELSLSTLRLLAPATAGPPADERADLVAGRRAPARWPSERRTGSVILPQAVRTRSLRLEILSAAAPPGRIGGRQARRRDRRADRHRRTCSDPRVGHSPTQRTVRRRGH